MKIEQNRLYPIFPLKNNELKGKGGEEEKGNVKNDVYRFQVTAHDLKEFFDLVEKYDVIREEKLDLTESQVSGKEVVLKMLGER